MRYAELKRKTSETDIMIELNIDGTGKREINTGIGFFDHMLDLFAKHGLFDLKVRCQGDTWIDDHHTVEDVGIVLGRCFAQAISDKRGIRRYGQSLLPMDEVLCLCGIDLSGRQGLVFEEKFRRPEIKGFSTECVYEFFYSFAMNSQSNICFKILSGINDHHKIEGIFKSFGRALRDASEYDERLEGDIPSTKGMLE
ncbi:MAG: imidazoleglycerol-phosphate dehydratase HisB [Candidatus Woesearchaeota archaeon]